MSKNKNKNKNKEDPNLRRVKQLEEGDVEGLRSLYAQYRDTCIDGGGSPAWARETSVLVLTLLDRLEEAKGLLKHGFRVGDRVELLEDVYNREKVWGAEKEGVISTIWMPEDGICRDFGVTFTREGIGSWELNFDADELRKVEDD